MFGGFLIISLCFFQYDFSWPILCGYYILLDKSNISLLLLVIVILVYTFFSNVLRSKIILRLSFLSLFLLGSFSFNDIFFFYIFFELSLLPTFYIIFSWGLQPERLLASSYFLVYALLGSFPLFAKIVYLIREAGGYYFSLNFFEKNYYFFVFLENSILVFFWLFSFLVKLPIYGFHLWLPKAHVEAPVFGSMILAAVLLKLGAYGLFRLGIYGILKFSFFLVWVVVTIVLVGIITFRANDIKCLIAYSSIAHMGFSCIFFFLLKPRKMLACLFILIGHGFIRSSFFFIFKVLYNSTGSRKVFLNTGFCLSHLFYFLFFFIVCLNCSLPLNLTFFSEVLLGLTVYYVRNYFLFFFILSVLLVGLYNINLFLSVNQGAQSPILKTFYLFSLNKFSGSITLFHICLNFVLVYSGFFWAF